MANNTTSGMPAAPVIGEGQSWLTNIDKVTSVPGAEPAAAPALQGTTKQLQAGVGESAPISALPEAAKVPKEAPVIVKPEHKAVAPAEETPLLASRGKDKVPTPSAGISFDFEKTAPKPVAGPSFVDQMIRGVGAAFTDFGYGSIHGVSKNIDATQALANAMLHGSVEKTQRVPTGHELYEQGLAPETKESIPFKAGSIAGELGSYIPLAAATAAAAETIGLPAAGTAAAIYGGGAIEGAILNMASGAQERHGAGTPTDLLIDAAIGVGLGLTGGALGVTVGKGMQAVGKRLEIMKAARELAAKDAKRQTFLDELQEELMEEVHKIDVEGHKILHEIFDKPQPKTPLQNKQAEVLASKPRMRMNLERAKQGIDDATEEAAEEVSGAFRFPLRQRRTGFEALDNAVPLQSLAKALSRELYEQLSKAIEEIGQAMALRATRKNDREAFAENALSLIKTPEHAAKIEKRAKQTLTHAAQQKKDKAKAELALRQQLEQQQGSQLVRNQLLADLEAAQKAGNKNRIKELRGQIQELDEALQRDALGDMFDLNKGKHLYALVDRFQLFSQPILAKTFNTAFKQFKAATTLLNEAEKELADIKKHYQPLFEEVEKAYQQHLGDKVATPRIGFTVRHPGDPALSTDAAIHLQHNPYAFRLNAQYQQLLEQADKALRASEENVKTAITYSLGKAEQLIRQSPKEAADILRKTRAIHPKTKHLLWVGAMGLAAADTPAQALDFDSMTPKEQREYMGIGTATAGAIAATMAGIFIAKAGHGGARRLMRMPQVYFQTMWKNLNDDLRAAEKVMGLHPIVHKGTHLSIAMNELRGQLTRAGTLLPDYMPYFNAALKGKLTAKEIELLSPEAQDLAKDIAQRVTDLEAHARAFRKAWKKKYATLSQKDQEAMAGINGSVDFAHAACTRGAADIPNFYDDNVAKAMMAFCKVQFTWNPQNLASAVIGDVLAVGPLQFGPATFAAAYRDWIADNGLRTMVSALNIQGPRSEALQAVTKPGRETVRLLAEKAQQGVIAAASAYHYFDANSEAMKLLNIATRKDFLRAAFNDLLPEEIAFDFWQKLALDISETVGGDVLHANTGPLARSKIFKNIVAFASQPERDARLMTLNTKLIVTSALKGDFKTAVQRSAWMGASLAGRWQFAGKAAIPASVATLGLALPFTAGATAQVMAWLDDYSLGTKMGNMSGKVDYDPFAFFLMGVTNPGMQEVLEATKDIPHKMEQIGAIPQLVMWGQGADILTGSKSDENVERAQKGLHGLMGDAATIYAFLGGNPAPIRMLGNAIYNLPEVINDEYYFSVPRKALGSSGAFPLEGAKVRYGTEKGQAAWDSMYKVLGLGDAPRVAKFKAARQGIKSGGSTDTLEDIVDATGISR